MINVKPKKTKARIIVDFLGVFVYENIFWMVKNENRIASAFFCKSEVRMSGENDTVAKRRMEIWIFVGKLCFKRVYNGITISGIEKLSIVFTVFIINELFRVNPIMDKNFTINSSK